MDHDALPRASRPGAGAAALPTLWRYFPLWLLLSFVLVAAVNITMVWDALTSYPGDAVHDDFGTSNRYDQVLAQAERQAALGWTVTADLSAGHPVLTVAGPGGQPLSGASVAGLAEHPLGPADAVNLDFAQQSSGHYISNTALAAGRWDMLLRVTQNGHTFAVTRRVTVR